MPGQGREAARRKGGLRESARNFGPVVADEGVWIPSLSPPRAQCDSAPGAPCVGDGAVETTGSSRSATEGFTSCSAAGARCSTARRWPSATQATTCTCSSAVASGLNSVVGPRHQRSQQRRALRRVGSALPVAGRLLRQERMRGPHSDSVHRRPARTPSRRHGPGVVGDSPQMKGGGQETAYTSPPLRRAASSSLPRHSCSIHAGVAV
jgi:hypothetical protein